MKHLQNGEEKGFQLRILFPARLPIKYETVSDMQRLKFTSYVPFFSEPLKRVLHQNESKIKEDRVQEMGDLT